MSSKAEVLLPRPLPHQAPVIYDDSRYKLMACGRRWGKSMLSAMALFIGHGSNQQWKGALTGGLVWYIAPTYQQARDIIWPTLKRIAQPLLQAGLATKNEQQLSIDIPATNGAIFLKSADKPDTLRGSGLDGVVIDEAAMIRDEDVWYEAIRPALMDKRGWAILISTPKGFNWFHRLYLEAIERENWRRWQQPTSANPILTAEEIEEAAKELDSQSYAQEILAQFVSPSGSRIQKDWFRYYRQIGPRYVLLHPSGDTISTHHRREYRRVMLVDPAGSGRDVVREKQGKQHSYTAIGTFDIHGKEGHLIWVNVTRGRWEIPEVCDLICRDYGTWEPDYIGIENQGLGLAVMQTLKYRPVPIKALKPRGQDKVERATKALVMMEQAKVYHPEAGSMVKDPQGIAHPTKNWLRDLENELLMWTGHTDDTADQVDILSYAGMDAMGQGALDSPTLMHVDREPSRTVQFRRRGVKFGNAS